jgi:predicted MPP superfamily phosphohydrolase
MGRLPLNELWHLHVSCASLRLPGLPAGLAGLSICHWSDLHISGRLDRDYYREVVRATNQIEADLLALTGDICDDARYFDWIVDILADAKAPLGKFFILGNHDLRTRNVPRLRAAMVEAGFVDVGGRALTIHGDRLLIAGDERPWFDGEPELPRESEGSPRLRLLLAHTPDRLAWARAHGFALMLSGHTHGGQIRLPLVGATVCPSWHGTRYASGYHHEPPTLLHVSRGTGSLFPYRLGCPPEITKLVLQTGP